jgi:uncharacterized damage-inducible protein DinB
MRQLIKHTALLLPIFILVNSFQASSQSLSSDDIKSQLVKEWQRAKDYTIEYLNTMPANKYSFKAQDSIRSFAQQMLHLSAANCFLMSQATGAQMPAFAMGNIEGRASAASKDSVMYFVTNSYDFAANAVKNSDATKWGESRKIFGFETTQFGLMLKAFEHQTHHRGQTTIYIRLQGIKPPQEKLF